MFVIEHSLDHIDTTTHDIANDDTVRINRELFRIHAFVNLYTKLF